MSFTDVRVQVPPRAPKRKTGKSLSFFGLWGCEESAFIGAPARIQRSGSRGERSHSGATELSPPGGSEGCTACGDAVPPRAQKKRDIRWTALFFSSWGCEESAFYRGPRANPAQRFSWGKEPQRSDRAFAARRKREMRSLRRRRPASLQRIRGTPGRHLTLASFLAIIKSDNGCRRQSI